MGATEQVELTSTLLFIYFFPIVVFFLSIFVHYIGFHYIFACLCVCLFCLVSYIYIYMHITLFVYSLLLLYMYVGLCLAQYCCQVLEL